MYFFLVQWVVLLGGLALHVGLDRSPERRTRRRVVELVLLWFVVANGVFMVLGGIVHVGPGSVGAAAQIGFAPSAFQWEVGVYDLAMGIAGVACARRTLRGGFTDATVVITALALLGDGIGHVVQLAAHGNDAVNNVGAIPTCFVVPVVTVVALLVLRRLPARAAADADDEPGDTGSRHRRPAVSA